MRGRTCVPLLAGVTLLAAAPAAVAEAPVLRVTSAWTQVEQAAGCDGEPVEVTYDGTLVLMSVGDGLWLRARADFRFEQDGVLYTGRSGAGFTAPPSGRSTTYRFQGSAVGEDGGRVHVHEIVHAVWSGGVPQVRVELERVDCR